MDVARPPASRAIVRRCQELPGQQLFQYLDDDGEPRGRRRRTTSTTTCATPPATTSPPRTSARGPGPCLPPGRSRARRQRLAAAKQHVVAAIESVATELGNTPAVCRACYVHPDVMDAHLDGTLKAGLGRKAEDPDAGTPPALPPGGGRARLPRAPSGQGRLAIPRFHARRLPAAGRPCECRPREERRPLGLRVELGSRVRSTTRRGSTNRRPSPRTSRATSCTGSRSRALTARWTPSSAVGEPDVGTPSPRAASPQQLVEPDRQVADADARRVVHRVRDRRPRCRRCRSRRCPSTPIGLRCSSCLVDPARPRSRATSAYAATW